MLWRAGCRPTLVEGQMVAIQKALELFGLHCHCLRSPGSLLMLMSTINEQTIGMTIARTPWWAWTWPILAWVILSVTPFASPAGFIAAAAGVALILAVFAAVYHAEVVAHRTGEPFGTLVLAVAVTIIEVALIVSVMVAAPAEKAGLARDTVFAVVMIVCNGVVGLCLLWGGARHHEQGFQVHGASAALAVLAALTMLTLVLPNFATS